MTIPTSVAHLCAIFRLRSVQAMHLYADTGLIYSLIILLLAAAGFVWAGTVAESDGYVRFVPAGIFAVIVYSIQMGRKDRNFLTIVFGGFRSIFIAEYAIISLPFVILYLLAHQWTAIAAIVASAALAAFVPQTEIKRSLFGGLWEKIPAQAYEIKSFMRRSGAIFLALWALMAGLSFYPVVVPIGIALGSLFAAGCYEWGEPESVLRSAQLAPEAFLRLRTMLAAKLMLLWTAVPALLFLGFNISYWYIIPVEMAAVFIVLRYMISVKYAFYQPNEKLSSRLFAALASMGIIIPVLLPLLLLLTFYFRHKAVSNLNPYLRDFDTVA